MKPTPKVKRTTVTMGKLMLIQKTILRMVSETVRVVLLQSPELENLFHSWVVTWSAKICSNPNVHPALVPTGKSV